MGLDRFISTIENRDATIAIIGLGYVGIPLAVAMTSAGLKVLGFDIDSERVAALNQGRSNIKTVSDAQIAAMRDGLFEASDDFSRIASCDAIVICVPTPLNSHREPDLSFIKATMETITPYLRPYQLLSLESTTWPGTTTEIVQPYITGRGFAIGDDFYLAYSPEREDPGNSQFTTGKIPKIIGGCSKNCLAAADAVYGAFVEKTVPVSSTAAAEMVKLLENIHRSINIGLVNEMKIVADKMGLDIFEIIDAAKTKPFGFTAYYPGPGIGGHCIPIDPFYLTWKAREYGLHTRFIELAGEINAAMPNYVLDKIIASLNAAGKSVQGASILVLGIAYKKDVDDTRESPAVFVMELLREWGAKIDYSDPNVPNFPKMRNHTFDLQSITLTPQSIASYDAAVLLTDHSGFDYDMIKKYAKLLIDTRGHYRFDANVIRA